MEIRETPWLNSKSASTIEKLIRNNPRLRVLEFGCGKSTIWLSERMSFPGATLTSVEHVPGHYEATRERIPQEVDLRLIQRPCANVCDEFANESFDLVIIGGEDHILCATKSMRLVRPGGYIVVSSSDRHINDCAGRLILTDWQPHQSEESGGCFVGVWQKTTTKNAANVPDETLVAHGESHAHRGNFEMADQFARLAIEKNSNVADALNLLAVSSCSRSGVSDAVGLLEAGRTLDPGNTNVGKNLALVYSNLGRRNDAIEVYSDMLVTNPMDRDIHQGLRNLGETHMADNAESMANQFDNWVPSVFPVEVSAVCNLRCPECASGSGMKDCSKRFMTLDEFKHIAEKIRPYSRETLLHLWGEPMLNPDIYEMIRIASEFSRVNISTNGMMLDEQSCERLILSGVGDLIVSIDGITQEVYAIYRRGGNVEKAKNVLRWLSQSNAKHGYRVNIIPQFIVFKHNQHEMAEFEAFCNSIGLRPSFKAPYLREDSQLDLSDYPQFHRPGYPDEESLQKAISECATPRRDFNIQVDGTVVLCCYDYDGRTSFGSIFEQDVMSIWNSETSRSMRWGIISGNPPAFCREQCLMYSRHLKTAPQQPQQNAVFEAGKEASTDWLREISARINQACGDTSKLVQIAGELAEHGHDDTAEELMRMVINQNPNCADAFNTLGVIYFSRGRGQDALRYFETARRSDPGNTDIGKNIIAVHVQSGQYDKAVEVCQDLLQRCPSDPELPEIIGSLLQSISDFALNALDVVNGARPAPEPEPTAPQPAQMSVTEPFSATGHSCLFINTAYAGFLNEHYGAHPDLVKASYAEQLASITGRFFGDSDCYSNGLREAGWQAGDIVVNCIPLQEAWARENGFGGHDLDIAVEQVRRMRPEVVYIQDLVGLPVRDFCRAIRPHVRLIVGQIATVPTQNTDFSEIDLVFTACPQFVERLRAQGVTTYYQPLAFDPRVLEHSRNGGKQYAATFIGGISHMHIEGNKLLEMLARSTPVEFWGYGQENLPADSAILGRHHGPAWGLDMFSLLRQSQMTVNRHGEIAENFAANMRMFEATGCGTLLVTDYKDNLNELFEIGRECVAYRTPEECAALVRYYSEHPEEAEAIARAGQERTLRDHTYNQRMKRAAAIMERHIRYRAEAAHYAAVDTCGISCGHTSIAPGEVTESMLTAWQSEDIPEKQRAVVQDSLARMFAGQDLPVCQIFADAIRPYVRPGSTILEIGCSSGYYYEILEYLLNTPLNYTGVDYSEAMVKMARDYYPDATFVAADGASLPFEDSRFEIAISSCVLLHVPNYKEHIKETARVAGRIVVAHRTPVCKNRPTQYMKKLAYGIETVELMFNESELLAEFAANGLRLISSIDEHANQQRDEYAVTYVFERV